LIRQSGERCDGDDGSKISLRSYPQTAFAAHTTPRRGPQCEESDHYREVVATLNPKLRVIRGKCGLQWIAQKKERPTRWTSFAYCATKEGLLLRLPKGGYGCNPEAWAIIEALPAYFPKKDAGGESERASARPALQESLALGVVA